MGPHAASWRAGVHLLRLIEGKPDKVSLSFLVDELEIHRGGIAANVAFGMARLGLRPMLAGSVGAARPS